MSQSQSQSYNWIGQSNNQAYIFNFKNSGSELNKEIEHQ